MERGGGVRGVEREFFGRKKLLILFIHREGGYDLVSSACIIPRSTYRPSRPSSPKKNSSKQLSVKKNYHK